MPRAKKQVTEDVIMEEPEALSPPPLKRQVGAVKISRIPKARKQELSPVDEEEPSPAKAPRKRSAWNDLVSKVRKEHPDKPFGDCIKLARSQYKPVTASA